MSKHSISLLISTGIILSVCIGIFFYYSDRFDSGAILSTLFLGFPAIIVAFGLINIIVSGIVGRSEAVANERSRKISPEIAAQKETVITRKISRLENYLIKSSIVIMLLIMLSNHLVFSAIFGPFFIKGFLTSWPLGRLSILVIIFVLFGLYTIYSRCSRTARIIIWIASLGFHASWFVYYVKTSYRITDMLSYLALHLSVIGLSFVGLVCLLRSNQSLHKDCQH